MTTSRSKSAATAAHRHQSLVAIGTLLPILQRGYRAAADKAVDHLGLSQSMAWPLVMIGRQGDGVRPGVLADALAVEGASLVRQLDQLVQAGLVERREDPRDRRARTLHLTVAGRDAASRIEQSLDAMRDQLFEGVPDADVDACLRLFGTLAGRLGKAAR